MPRVRPTTAWIASAALAAAVALPASAADPAPDYELFKARVEPVLQTVCAQCHAGKGQGRLALVVHAPGAPFPDAEHRRNYETVLRLVEAGNPDRSPFLQKPLANSRDGLKHGGGDRIFPGTPAYRAWVDFIRGARFDGRVEATPGPATLGTAASPEAAPATVGDRPLVLEAEALALHGDAAAADAPGASGRVVAAGAGGGRVEGAFRVARAGTYALSLRAGGAKGTLSVAVDGGAPLSVAVEREAIGTAAPRVLCDGGRPLDALAGEVAIADGRLRLSGAPARFLSPADVGHTRIEARFAGLAPGSTAALLFDVVDAANAKLVALEDGGAQVTIGVVEGGRSRVLARAPRPAGLPGERLGVDFVDGVAVARVDGRPVVHVNFDRALGAGRFGVEVRGSAALLDLAAYARDREVHRFRPSAAGVVALARGDHRIEVVLPPGGPVLDSLTLHESRLP